MKLRLFLLFFILVPFVLNGQNKSMDILVDAYSQRAEKIDWDNSSTENILKKIFEISLKIRAEYSDVVDSIKEDFKKNKSGLTEEEIEFEYQTMFLLGIIEKCPAQMKFIKNTIKPCPKENGTFKLIRKRIDKVLGENQVLSYKKQFDLANNQIFNIINDNKDQVNKDYTDMREAYLKISDNIGAYLLHKSDLYFKAFIISCSLEQTKKLSSGINTNKERKVNESPVENNEEIIIPVENQKPAFGIEKNEEPVFVVVEKMPSLPGGIVKYLKENLKYPVIAEKQKITGRVYVGFIIEKDGSVSNVRVLRPGAPSLDTEALRVVKAMPKWIPGKQRGKNVRVSYTVPIDFQL